MESIPRDADERQAEEPPEELRQLRWAVWKYGKMRPNGSREKVPCTPSIGRYARINDATTFGSYEEARAALAASGGEYEGIGFLLMPDDEMVVLDVDVLKHEQSDMWRWWVQRDDTYAEYSPSGVAVHVIVRGRKPKGVGQKLPNGNEILDAGFVTWTGKQLQGTPSTLASGDDAERIIYMFLVMSGHTETHQRDERSALPNDGPLTESDDEVLRHCQQSETFQRLWRGDGNGYKSSSEADLALAGHLVRYTRNKAQIERLMRRSGLVRDKWDSHATYLVDKTINKALQGRRRGRRPTYPQKVLYTYDWQQKAYNPDALNEAGLAAQREATRHVNNPQPGEVLMLQVPPGAGKTHRLADLGKSWRVAFMAERHSQYDAVSGFSEHNYFHRERCTPENCREAARLNSLASRGYNVGPTHKAHDCAYFRQGDREAGNTFYVQEHASMPDIGGHDFVVIDEWGHGRWLPTQDFNSEDLASAIAATSDDDAQRLLDAINTLLAKKDLTGRALFDALNTRLNGELEGLLFRLSLRDEATTRRPELSQFETASPRVVLPFIVLAMLDEMDCWKEGTDWNSRLVISGGKLRVTVPREIARNAPPLIIADATANPDVVSAALGRNVTVYRHDADPPPNMRHIHVQSSYSKQSMRFGRQKAIADVRFIAKELGIDAGRVALITYKDHEQEIADACGIVTHDHFGNIRGSNAFQDCDVLIVLGTPRVNGEEVIRLARAIHWQKPAVSTDFDKTNWRYVDEDVQRVDDGMARDELTQAAHRNRPLRFDGRTVVTMSGLTPDFLPVTEEWRLPAVDAEGKTRDESAGEQRKDRQLLAAYNRLVVRGVKLSGAALAKEARMRKDSALEWLRQRARDGAR